MSASTSITPNPPSRRRSVLAEATSSAVSGDPNSAVKDLTRSFSGEAAVAMKKPPPTAAVHTPALRRAHRKSSVGTEKSRKATLVSVLVKNLCLLIVLFGLVQMLRRLVRNTDREGFEISTGREFERRIAEIEGLLKKTTKMMQVQVEVVDTKLEKRLVEVKMDLNKKINEKNKELVNEMRKFDGSIEGLERALGELKAEEWMKKGDLDGFIEEIKKRKVGNGDGDVVFLDEVREAARGVVERELERFAADGLGMVDYAVASGGAMVVTHSEGYGVGRGNGWFKRVKNGVHDDAVKMISSSFGEPGQCFPLKGNSGFVQIKLRTAIVPEAVTLEHVANSVAFDRSSAPKDCKISGWLQKHDITGQAIDTEKMILLTEFTYDLEKSNAQTFDVLDTPIVVDTIRLDFTSNHGNPAHTCIYRLRVHGHEAESISMLAEQS